MQTAHDPVVESVEETGDPRACPRSRIAWIAWAAPTAVAATFPLAAVLISGHTLAWRDTARLFAPLRVLVVEALRAFRLPLWNPHEGCGVPLFAQLMHGALHPLSVLGAFLAPGAGMDAFIVGYVVLAAVGAALLARQLGASCPAAIAAGVCYGLSGYVLSMSAVVQYLAAAGSAPWVVAALRSAGMRPTGIAAAALAVTVLHLAGDPQWTVVAALLGVMLAAEARGPRGLAGAFLAILLGTALAAIQLVPTWFYLQETVRGFTELPLEERTQWALAPWRLVELVAPGFFGGSPGVSPTAPVFMQLGRPATGFSFFASYSIPFVPSVFVGAVSLALAGLGARSSRAGRLLGASAVVTLWIALGRQAGAEQLLHRVPVWGSFRYAEKMVGPFTLCVALLTAMGVERVASARTGGLAKTAVAASVVVTGLAVWLAAGGGEGLLQAVGAGPVASLARWRLAVGLYHTSAALGSSALLLGAATRWPTRVRLAPAAAVLVFLQSSAASPFALHAGTPGVRDPEPLRRLAGRDEVVRVGTPLRSTPELGPPELDDSDRTVAVDSRMGVTPFPVSGHLDQIETYTGLPPMALVMADNAIRWNWQARRRYGLTHVVLRDLLGQGEAVRVGPAISGGRPLFRVPEFGFTVWEVPHRPWAAFAERVLPAADGQEAFRLLQSAAGTGSPEVILEGPPPQSLATGRVLSVERKAERLRVEAQADGEGLLVVNDTYWPGWTATVDGQPVPIFRADILVRAVRWPPGRHVLEMRYEPREVRVGAWSSAAAALGVAVLVALGWTRRRARRSR